MINKVSHSNANLLLALTIGASVNFLITKVGQKILQKDFPEDKAHPLAIVTSTIGSLIGVYLYVDDRTIALAFLVGIVVATIFSIWCYERSKASE